MISVFPAPCSSRLAYHSDDEDMLEIAALYWGRDNMKKSMPSMSIQASVIQPAAHCAAGALAELVLVRYSN